MSGVRRRRRFPHRREGTSSGIREPFARRTVRVVAALMTVRTPRLVVGGHRAGSGGPERAPLDLGEHLGLDAVPPPFASATAVEKRP